MRYCPEEEVSSVIESVKRWTILDKLTNKIFDVTDKHFAEGLKNKWIKLKGQFIQVENGHKIWIDGITDR